MGLFDFQVADTLVSLSGCVDKTLSKTIATFIICEIVVIVYIGDEKQFSQER